MITIKHTSIYAKATHKKVSHCKGCRYWRVYDDTGKVVSTCCDIIRVEGKIDIDLRDDGTVCYWNNKGIEIETIGSATIIIRSKL